MRLRFNEIVSQEVATSYCQASFFVIKFSRWSFLLIIFIILLGGFSIVLAGHEISATSVYKPIGILLASFVVKLFVADFKQEFEKNKVLVMSTLLVMMLLCEVSSRIYYSVFVPQDLFWATENLGDEARRPVPICCME